MVNAKLIIQEEKKYKLFIPRSVEKKIRYHIQRFPSREWSGYLFYTYTGSFEEDNIEFTAKDFVVLDIGNEASTSFKESPKVLNYMVEHDLLDCKEALIHSHHTMGAFFSGTDNTALCQEGLDVNHFLSLVVDTRGTYVARVTKRNQIKKHIHQTIVEETCYPTYEDKLICVSTSEEKNEDFIKETSEIIAYPLIVEREIYEDASIAEWNADIEEAMKSSYPNTPRVTSPNVERPTQLPLASSVLEKEIFEDKDFETPQKKQDSNEELVDVSSLSYPEIDRIIHTMYTNKDIQHLLLQIVSGTPFIDISRVVNLPQYVVKLTIVTKERFYNREAYFAFVDNLIQSLMEDFGASKCAYGELADDFMSCVAADLQELIVKLPKNDFIQHIDNELVSYLV